MFKGKETTVAGYLAALPDDKRKVAREVVTLVRKNLPAGYEEGIGWGVITWSVPLSVLPDTYNKQPLCYVALGANKGGFSLYLMGVYGDAKLRATFEAAVKKAGKKLDMGKSCLHFRTMDDLAVPAVARAVKAIPMKKWAAHYEATRGKSKGKARRT